MWSRSGRTAGRHFAGRTLAPELFEAGIILVPTILLTGTRAGGPSGRGGVSKWAKIEKDVRLRLGTTPHWAAVTTLLDYYGLPQDSPGMAERPAGSARRRVEYVEQQIAARIDHPRFLPYLVLHETETWVFAAAGQLGEWVEDGALAAELKRQADAAGGPECVNDGADTAPSKRLLGLYPAYNKTQDGPVSVADLGLAELRAACPHFDSWIGRLLALA
ncbi:hypothetical protein SLUN_16060 [Streptomyces lunaelactis]|uniref:DUF4276 domain-containing protein n=1 Tax=Streptomyces lunaelactis TaxID=1535768 RepID=A0A2R4T2Y9_9ACTN|nr:DUF4276 family protein [Streptomyces lunaelactis]AVZ73466.1 hypothetical protein SLUN_16060 [Streptomyces lunaelactis]NUK89572.1 DUF4276 family protein [Streptomyces lunaelactis]